MAAIDIRGIEAEQTLGCCIVGVHRGVGSGVFSMGFGPIRVGLLLFAAYTVF